MVTGEIYGEEAVEAYADGNGVYDCSFTQNVGTLEFDGATSATTYHIELRYGSDIDALAQYNAGNYAYWLAAGISTEYDQEMIENCIKLFCTENLSE